MRFRVRACLQALPSADGSQTPISARSVLDAAARRLRSPRPTSTPPPSPVLGPRLRSRPGTALLLALTAASCAFEPGNPWGEVRFDLEAAFEAGPRATPEGRVRTARSYEIDIERLEVHFDSVALEMLPEGGAIEFDPADPPPGFSLCHNGHCHAADGRLVDYEQVAIEAAAASGDAGGVLQAVDVPVVLTEQPASVPLGPCQGECLVNPGDLNAVKITIGRVSFEGRVFDTGADRLPAEGVQVRFDLPLGVALQKQVQGSVGKDDPVIIDVDLNVVLVAPTFDGLDFATSLPENPPTDQTVDISGSEGVLEAVGTAIQNATRSEIVLTRINP